MGMIWLSFSSVSCSTVANLLLTYGLFLSANNRQRSRGMYSVKCLLSDCCLPWMVKVGMLCNRWGFQVKSSLLIFNFSFKGNTCVQGGRSSLGCRVWAWPTILPLARFLYVINAREKLPWNCLDSQHQVKWVSLCLAPPVFKRNQEPRHWLCCHSVVSFYIYQPLKWSSLCIQFIQYAPRYVLLTFV